MSLRLTFVRVAIGLVVLTVLAAVGLCASVVFVGLQLASPVHHKIGPPPADLADAKEIHIPSPSGSMLIGWWINGRPNGGAVILMHGVHSNRTSMLARATKLHQQGFAVLLFDFQSHGESTGKEITFGHLEALDADAAVAFVRDRRPGERVAALGVSLGGAAALLGPKPLPVDALVLESVYPDIGSALSDRLRSSLGPILAAIFTPVLTPLFELLLPPILGVNMDQLRPIDHIGAVTAPILMLSGTADDHTTIAEARDLYRHARAPKRFWAMPGAGHVDLEHFNPSAYWEVVLPFLTEQLQRDHSCNARSQHRPTDCRKMSG